MNHHDVKDHQFAWPLLKAHELARCLSECELRVTAADISTPNKEKIKEIYLKLCTLLSGDCMEEIENPNFDAMETTGMAHPKLYQDAITELATYRAIAKLMTAASIHHFSIQHDLLEPEGNRTIYNLSGLMNFAKFREVQLQFYSELTQEADQILTQKENELETQEKLKKQLHTLLEEKKAKQSVYEKLNKQKEELSTLVRELNKKQSQLREESSEVKQKNTEAKANIESLETVSRTTTTQTQRLRQGIVENPQELLEFISSLKEKINDEKKQKNVVDKKNRAIRGKMEQIQKLHKEVDKCIELLEKCTEEWERSKASNKENKQLAANLAEYKQKLVDIARSAELIEKQNQLANERFEKFHSKQTEKLNQAKCELEDVQNQYNAAIQRENTELHHKIENNYKIATEYESNLEELQSQHQHFVRTIEENYGFLREELGLLHTQILDKIDKFDSSNKI